VKTATASTEVDDASIERALDVYLGHLERELRTTEGYRVMPGIREAVARVSGRDGVAVGLGTGNVKRGAYAKLVPGGLHEAFAFGGFGCDAEDRAELLRAGARRGAEALGVTYAECRVVVIGDTPKDVAAALAIGAVCVGVGTGGHAPDELRALGAAFAFADFAEHGALGALDALLSEP
jgi:phosphoglycolate phosphatase-like HAD superfamily hydrolase